MEWTGSGWLVAPPTNAVFELDLSLSWFYRCLKNDNKMKLTRRWSDHARTEVDGLTKYSRPCRSSSILSRIRSRHKSTFACVFTHRCHTRKTLHFDVRPNGGQDIPFYAVINASETPIVFNLFLKSEQLKNTHLRSLCDVRSHAATSFLKINFASRITASQSRSGLG